MFLHFTSHLAVFVVVFLIISNHDNNVSPASVLFVCLLLMSSRWRWRRTRSCSTTWPWGRPGGKSGTWWRSRSHQSPQSWWGSPPPCLCWSRWSPWRLTLWRRCSTWCVFHLLFVCVCVRGVIRQMWPEQIIYILLSAALVCVSGREQEGLSSADTPGLFKYTLNSCFLFSLLFFYYYTILIPSWEIPFSTHITHTHTHTHKHMQCRGDERRGSHTCHGAQRAVLGVGALLKGTSAMPRMWTSTLQLPIHINFFFFPTDWAIAYYIHDSAAHTHGPPLVTVGEASVSFLLMWYTGSVYSNIFIYSVISSSRPRRASSAADPTASTWSRSASPSSPWSTCCAWCPPLTSSGLEAACWTPSTWWPSCRTTCRCSWSTSRPRTCSCTRGTSRRWDAWER